jgi:hypothetical protein
MVADTNQIANTHGVSDPVKISIYDRFRSEVGRAAWKNSDSTRLRSTPRCLARSSTKDATPSDSVGRGAPS